MNPPYWFELLDQLRRLQGTALDRFGLGPRESAFQVLFTMPGLRLRCYGTGAAHSLPLLIVPAPIKQPYIWDLSPERSVVRRAIEHKLGVYLVEWTEPGEGTRSPGLSDYAGPMLDACIDATAEQAHCDRVFLMGHSLGGIIAAIHSAYRPEHVAGLALIEAPLHFPEMAGTFQSLPELGIRGRQEFRSSSRVPGSLLSMISASAAPGTFCVSRYLDWLASMASVERTATHWRVERWTMDELPMPSTLFDDVVEGLFRQNSFMRGELAIDGVRLHPRDITAPLLSVYQPSSTITPPESVLAFHRAAGSRDQELVPYFGDIGVALQHVGPLIGDNAYRHVWPRVFNWLDRIVGARVDATLPGSTSWPRSSVDRAED
ncbi:MAG TPA: alpha/beta fold hydrolase [Janthinobacterium sp.]|nr:alpha/beta fold hydrolase [Janthinobacterium sp.]